MGFETFQVELCGGTAQHQEAVHVVRTIPHARPDSDSLPMRGSTYFIIEDGQHVIEIEINDYSPLRLSCQFTLCHPPSIDKAFLAIVRTLMSRLGLHTRVCDDANERFHSLDEFSDLVALASRHAAVRRAEWIAMFGEETLVASTTEVHQRILIPNSVPVTKQT